MPRRPRGPSRSRLQDRRLVRLDEAWLCLPNRWGIPVEVCAGAEVPIEPAAVDELGSVLQTAETFERLARDVPDFLGREGEARLSRIALMPDVHQLDPARAHHHRQAGGGAVSSTRIALLQREHLGYALDSRSTRSARRYAGRTCQQ